MLGRSYHRVVDEALIPVFDGYALSDRYTGSSLTYDLVRVEVPAHVGDQIHVLYGDVYLVRSSGVPRKVGFPNKEPDPMWREKNVAARKEWLAAHTVEIDQAVAIREVDYKLAEPKFDPKIRP